MLTAKNDVIAIDVEVVSNMSWQRGFKDGSGFVSSCSKVLAHLKNSVVKFHYFLAIALL